MPLLLLLILAYAAFYSLLCWQRFATFHAQIDLSYYLRQIWGIGHGYYDLPLVQARNILGLHLEPVLLPLALLGRLGLPLAPLLLLSQAVAVGLLAWPAYRLGVRHLGGRGGGLAAAGVALLYPTVTVATLHDFHPVTLALAPLLATIDALDEGRFGRALLFGGLALLCREDIALQLLCLFAAYALGSQAPLGPLLRTAGRRLAFAALLAALALYFLGYIAWLQPRFVPAAGSYGLHFGKVAALLGGQIRSGRELLLGVLRHPLVLMGLLVEKERLLYLLLLLWPLALLPVLAPRPLAGLLPVLGINLLSSFPGVLRLESHYTTALVPFVIGAGLIGAGQLRRFAWARRPGMVPALLLFAVVTAHIFHGGSPLAWRSERFSWTLFRDGPGAAGLRQQVAAIQTEMPLSASVAARPGPLAHLCERPRAISPPEYDDGLPVDVTLRGE